MNEDKWDIYEVKLRTCPYCGKQNVVMGKSAVCDFCGKSLEVK